MTDVSPRRGIGNQAGGARLVNGGAAVAVILAGLAIRHPGLGLPWPIAKYGGSGLWGMMIYFLVSAAVPARTQGARAGLAALVATLVELSRLYHTPWLDAFRLTPAGALLLGRLFSGWNIVAYLAGIAAGTALDRSRPRG